MITTITATYRDGVLTPEEPLNLAEGQKVKVNIMDEGTVGASATNDSPAASFLARMAALRATVSSDAWDGAPTDFSKNKKRYLYGFPKEED